MGWSDKAIDLCAWLNRSVATTGRAGVRERYKISAHSWSAKIRPDCNAETIHAYLRAWMRTGDAAWLDRSRAIWTAVKPLQQGPGCWPYCEGAPTGWDAAHWANDNSEVVIFLLRASDLDPVNAAEYRAAAIATTDWLLSIQHPTLHSWRACEEAPYHAPWSTAHACTALATAYPHVDPARQSAYLAAIETGLATVIANIGISGRVLLGFEVHGSEEAWRPPSSEQSICVRALATCEQIVGHSSQRPAWTEARRALLGWLTPLWDATSGAMRNGYGVGVTHADVAHITDHVYTTAFAAEAYRLSWRLDHTPAYRTIADGILGFAAGNLYYSADPDANGVLRGAYDLTAQDWNTSEVAQNGGEEGGGDMAYSGWSAAPVAALLLTPARRRGGIIL